ncbi:hypothetical protein FA95DRAFT_1468584, partial [Auriscalpium vulgare]
TQAAVALLATASLMIYIVSHYRRIGPVLTDSQEELILVSAFGLFWLALLVAWRAVRQGSPLAYGHVGDIGGVSTAASPPRRDTGFTGKGGPWPCSSDDVICVVEEWSFF